MNPYNYGTWIIVINYSTSKMFHFKKIDDLSKYLNSIKPQPLDQVFVAVTINGEWRLKQGQLLFINEQFYIDNHKLPPLTLKEFINTLMPIRMEFK